MIISRPSASANEKSCFNFSKLPLAIQEKIVTELPVKDQIRFAFTSQSLYNEGIFDSVLSSDHIQRANGDESAMLNLVRKLSIIRSQGKKIRFFMEIRGIAQSNGRVLNLLANHLPRLRSKRHRANEFISLLKAAPHWSIQLNISRFEYLIDNDYDRSNVDEIFSTIKKRYYNDGIVNHEHL